MVYLGSWKLEDLLTFCANTHSASTGAATSSDAVPVYRVFEDETSASIASGTMATLASANITGFYSEQITLSSATGYEKGKSYNICVVAAVSSITGTMHHSFQIEAEVDANIVSDKTGYTASVSVGGISSAAFAASAINAAAIATGAISSAKFAADAINDAAVASDVTISSVTGSVGSIATGGISSASFAANSINAAAVAADVTTEITAAVASSADIATVLTRLGTPSDLGTGATVAANLVDIEGQTDDIGAAGAGLTALASSANLATVLTRLGTPSDLGGGATVAANLADIEAQTDDIGAAGAGLTALASSASVAALASSASLATAQTAITAVKAKTDSLTFTVAGQVDANVESVNATTVNGTGTSGDLWRGA